MAIKKILFLTADSHDGLRLDQMLAEVLPTHLKEDLSKSKIRKLIMAGAVYLNQRRVRIASKIVRSRVKVEVYLDWKKLEPEYEKNKVSFEMDSTWILFEDEDLIVINKPPGLPTQPTLDNARENLFALVKKFVGMRDQMSEVYLGLHHRLDRDTSGVILFTKTQRVNAAIGAQFSQHTLQKTYQALCLKEKTFHSPSRSWKIENYLKRSSSEKKKRMLSVHSGGDYALTQFEVKEDFKLGIWVEALPKTGRMHQIRVHLSEDGLPIFGDLSYGGPSTIENAGKKISFLRVMLHASSLQLIHPIHKKIQTFQSPLPKDFLLILQALRD